jgi:hypothetical protein
MISPTGSANLSFLTTFTTKPWFSPWWSHLRMSTGPLTLVTSRPSIAGMIFVGSAEPAFSMAANRIISA